MSLQLVYRVLGQYNVASIKEFMDFIFEHVNDPGELYDIEQQCKSPGFIFITSYDGASAGVLTDTTFEGVDLEIGENGYNIEFELHLTEAIEKSDRFLTRQPVEFGHDTLIKYDHRGLVFEHSHPENFVSEEQEAIEKFMADFILTTMRSICELKDYNLRHTREYICNDHT